MNKVSIIYIISSLFLLSSLCLLTYQTKLICFLHSTGTHGELVMNPDGAYSQLIRLQETCEEEQKLDCRRLSYSGSKSRRLSLNRSISIGSAGNSSRHSFTLAFGLPSSVEFLECSAKDGENWEEKGDENEVPERAPIGGLANLNKPEAPVLLFGSLAAGAHGVLFPVFGLMISNAIKAFYEPPHKLQKDSSHWALMCVVLAIVSIISIPAEY